MDKEKKAEAIAPGGGKGRPRLAGLLLSLVELDQLGVHGSHELP